MPLLSTFQKVKSDKLIAKGDKLIAKGDKLIDKYLLFIIEW